jgi:hypothetical protein
MNVYSISLFFHFLGLINLFGAMLMMHRVGARIRRAPTVEEVRLWLGFARTIQPFFILGSLLLLLTGLHMAGANWGFAQPWLLTGLGTVLALTPIGPVIQKPRFMAMGKAAAEAPAGPVPRNLAMMLTDPTPWRVASATAGAALALLWIMTQKPVGWIGCLAPVLLLAALGWFLGGSAASKDRAAAQGK